MFQSAEIGQYVIESGREKAKMASGKLFLLGIMAGMFIGLAALGANTAASGIENASVSKLVAACVFPVGLAMILIAGAELFTGNNLTIISVLEREITIWNLLRSWAMVYLGNFVGSIFISYIACISGQFDMFDGAVAEMTMKLAADKVSLSFGKAFGLGVLCNIVVCVAIWMSFSAKTSAGKIITIYLPVMLFVLAGLEHSIANMCYISSGLFAKMMPAYSQIASGILNIDDLTWGAFFVNNLIPVTLGNIFGGSVIVSGMYWLIYIKNNKKIKDTVFK